MCNASGAAVCVRHLGWIGRGNRVAVCKIVDLHGLSDDILPLHLRRRRLRRSRLPCTRTDITELRANSKRVGKDVVQRTDNWCRKLFSETI